MVPKRCQPAPRAFQGSLITGARLAALVSCWLAVPWAHPYVKGAEGPVPSPAAAKVAPSEGPDYEAEVRPILSRHCYECHSAEADELAASLRLDGPEFWLSGGESGPAVSVEHPDQSLLLRAVQYGDPDLQMPPNGKLAQREIDILTRWILAGSPASAPATPTNTSPSASSEKEAPPAEPGAPLLAKLSEADLEARRSKHWSWQPLANPAPPAVVDAAWPRDPLDQFILQGLEQAQLLPAQAADSATWLRRVTFALRGLPATPDEVREFLLNDSQATREAVVDRLLADRNFAETWAQHWLDLMRFAETRGHEQDVELPYAWRYRDYVIQAFHQDLPYDRLVTEHVAGDLVQPPRIDPRDQANASLQGTAFWHLGEATHSPVDILGDEADRVANQLDVFGKSFLGLTIGCVRCHDHKFDALSQADYYALAGYLQSSNFQLANAADPILTTRIAGELSSLQRHTAVQLAREWVNSARRELPTSLAMLRQAWLSVSDVEPAQSDAPTPARVAAWKKALEAARGRPDDPLFLLANASSYTQDPSTVSAERLRSWLHQQQAESATKLAARQIEVAAETSEGEFALHQEPWQANHQIVNYAQLDLSQPVPPQLWLTSGMAFGEQPVAGGGLMWQLEQLPMATPQPGTPEQTQGTALSATHRLRLRVAESPMAAGHWTSSRLTGQLRTPTFAVVGSQLWYRYRGEATVFMEVDSHRVVLGPLHGVVQQRLPAASEWTWFAHDVRDYQGHRVHVEFTPTGPFELQRVEFSHGEPPAEWLLSPATTAVTHALSAAEQPVDRESVFQLWAAAWGEFLEKLDHELQQSASSPDGAAGAAQWTNAPLAGLSKSELKDVSWLMAHPELWLTEPSLAAVLELASSSAQGRTQLEGQLPAPVWTPALQDGTAENEFIYLRGSHKRKAPQPTPRRFLQALHGSPPPPAEPGSGRLDLAHQLTSPRNPLLPRVYVNRVWHHLFGRGLVSTVDDFGAMGERPTHPELLDRLAWDFVQEGWSTKRLIKRLVLSRTWGMASQGHPQTVALSQEVDPANRLWHHIPVRRLPAEVIRDSLLALSGRLDVSVQSGPGVPVHLTSFMQHNRSPSVSGPLDGAGRRSLFLEVRRNAQNHFLAAFDRPIPFSTQGRRLISNSPAQPLMLLNDPLVLELSQAWGTRLATEFDSDTQAAEAAYLAALGRLPSAEELSAVTQQVGLLTHAGLTRSAAWGEVAHVLYNLKELIYVR